MVKPGERNGELKFSLRSLVNLPHDRVWIAGYKPSWLTNVGYISVIPNETKWQTSTANLLAACSHPEVSEDFVYFNDDFFVMKRQETMPVLHRGPVKKLLRYFERRHTGSRYVYGMRETLELMGELGLENPLSYEAHAPMTMSKTKMIETLGIPLRRGRSITALHKRTLYGNLWELGGDEFVDCKFFGARVKESLTYLPFISTTEQTFSHYHVGAYIRARFPKPSPYEKVMSDA